MSRIDTIAALEARYPGPVAPAATLKEVSRLTSHYRSLIEASPFVVLATSGPDGLDCSPRGDAPGFVRIVDDTTLILPDRRGAGRLDSLRNIISDPRVALLFLIPTSTVPLRVNGRAVISADPDVLAGFGPRDAPVTALIITIESVYFHSARPITKAGLWNPVTWGNPDYLPSEMDMLQEIHASRLEEMKLETA